MHLGTFNGLDLLALSPLKSSQQRRDSTFPWAAMRELAHLSCSEGTATSDEHLLGKTDSVGSCGRNPARCVRLCARDAARFRTLGRLSG